MNSDTAAQPPEPGNTQEDERAPDPMRYDQPVRHEDLDSSTQAIPTTTDTPFSLFLKGILMGSADIVPGVSGGTMALITGIYQRLIHAIKGIDLKFIPYFLQGERKKAKENFKAIDFQLLVPLGLGILLAFLTLARVIRYLMDDHRALVFAFFFGLILASAGIVYKYIEKIDIRNVLSALAGFVFVVLVIGLKELGENHSLPVIFLAGMVAIIAMILPGISGSLIMVILNQYEYMLDALRNFREHILDILVFMVGAVLGLAAFSRLLDYLLREHKSVTMAFLFGLMLGALRKPMEEIGGEVGTSFASMDFAGVVIAAVVGFAAVLLVELQAKKLEEQT